MDDNVKKIINLMTLDVMKEGVITKLTANTTAGDMAMTCFNAYLAFMD